MIYILLVLWLAFLAYIGATPEGRSWWAKTWAWMNPYDFEAGWVDGNALRERDRQQDVAAQSALHRRKVRQQHEDMVNSDRKRAERSLINNAMNAQIDLKVEEIRQQAKSQDLRGRLIDTRRRGAFLRVQDENYIDGEISGGVQATPQHYADKYGKSKTETEKTLETLKRIREASHDFEDGY